MIVTFINPSFSLYNDALWTSSLQCSCTNRILPFPSVWPWTQVLSLPGQHEGPLRSGCCLPFWLRLLAPSHHLSVAATVAILLLPGRQVHGLGWPLHSELHQVGQIRMTKTFCWHGRVISLNEYCCRLVLLGLTSGKALCLAEFQQSFCISVFPAIPFMKTL